MGGGLLLSQEINVFYSCHQILSKAKLPGNFRGFWLGETYREFQEKQKVSRHFWWMGEWVRNPNIPKLLLSVTYDKMFQ